MTTTIGSAFARLLDRDAALAKQLTARQNGTAKALLPPLSNAANHSKLWLAIALGSAALGGRTGRRAAQRGMLSVGIASAVANGVLKPLFPRERPPVDPGALPSLVRRPLSSSFPSGHAASAAAFAAGAALEAPAFAAPLAALAAAVGYSRVTTGVHYPSDVLFGAAIGVASARVTATIWPLSDVAPATARPVFEWESAADPSPTGDGVVLVVNAAAGPSAHESDLEVITGALPDLEVVMVEDPSTLEARFAEAASTAVVLGVLGGDGTIGAAAAAALDAEIPLAVFPGGTLNHFARDLGLDSVEDAIAALQDGQLVEVDTATIDGRTFLNTASFGSYAELVEARENYEDRIGKWPAVALALLKVLRHGEPVIAKVDGTERKIWMIFIGNGAYDPPGFVPATRNRLDDGQLDVRMVDGTEPYARVRLLAAVLTGGLGRSRIYTRQLVSELDITTEDNEAMLAADGEVFTGDGSFTISKSKRRLRTYAQGSASGFPSESKG